MVIKSMSHQKRSSGSVEQKRETSDASLYSSRVILLTQGLIETFLCIY
jgi:hypothetical protein